MDTRVVPAILESLPLCRSLSVASLSLLCDGMPVPADRRQQRRRRQRRWRISLPCSGSRSFVYTIFPDTANILRSLWRAPTHTDSTLLCSHSAQQTHTQTPTCDFSKSGPIYSKCAQSPPRTHARNIIFIFLVCII